MAGEAKTHSGKDKQKKDLRAELAERLLSSMEKNDAWWQKPWEAGDMGMPFNAITGKPYRGANAQNLMVFSPDPEDNRWCTYKQAKEAGWQVKKGEHGIPIEKWSEYKHKRTEEDIQKLQDAGAEDIAPEERRMGVRYYNVFHASQIDGIPPKERNQALTGRNNVIDERLPKLAEAMGIDVQHSGSRAFYRPGQDRVNMPPIEIFQTGRDHDTIFLHELSHSTGHESRLNRDLTGGFGSQKYAKEELRAELSAAMTALSLGIGFSPEAQQQEEGREVIAGVDNTARYLNNWLSALPEKDRQKEIMNAISDAQKISDYLIERTPELSVEQQQEMPGVSRGDYVRFRNEVGQEVEGIVLDNAQPGEATRLRPIDRFSNGAPILGGGDDLVPMVLPDNLVEHIPGAVTPGPDLDTIDPITEAYKRSMGMDDSRNQATQTVLAEVETSRGNPERNPRMANIQNLQVGDLIRTREKSLNEQGVFADRERLGIVTHLRTNDDGKLSAVASRWIYPYQEGEVPSQDFRGFVMSAGKDDVHQLADLKEQLLEVRKGVVSPGLASDNLQNREIREQFENAVNAYERKIVLEGGEPLISQDNSVKSIPADNDKYFVYEEHTLGFIRQDEAPDFFTPLAGERDWRNGGFHLLDSEKANLRPATEADFEKYRVVPPPDFRKTLTLDQLRLDIQEHQNSPEKLEGYLARAVENGYLFSAPMKTDNQVTVKFPHDVSEDGGYQLASFKGESVRTTSFHTLEGAAASFAGIADLSDLKIDRAPEQASNLKLDPDLVAFLQERHSIRQGEHPDYAGFSDPVANAEFFVTRQGRTDPQQATQWAKAIQDNPVEYGEAAGFSPDAAKLVASQLNDGAQRMDRPRVGDLVRFEPHEQNNAKSMPFSGRVVDALDTNTGDVRYHLRAEAGPDQGIEARIYGRDGQFREIAMDQAVGFDRALAPEPEKTQGFHVGDFVTTHENHFGADWNTHSILVGLDDQQVKLQNLYRSGQEWKVSPGIQTMSPQRFKQTVRHQVSGVVPPEVASAENGGHSIARRDRIEKAVNAFHAEYNLNYGKTPPTPERVPDTVRHFLGDRQALATDQLLRDKEGKAFYGDKMQELNNIIMDMPQSYETDGKSDAEKVAALRYFGPGNAQFFIIEKDRGDPENEGSGFPRQKQAFGLADLGEGAPEMGYINIEEITRAGAQLDYHFTPRNLLEIKQEKYPELMSLKDRAEMSPAFVAKHLAPPHESLSVFASASGQDLLGRVVLSDYGPDAKGNMGIQSDTTYVRFSPEINERGEKIFIARDRANPAGKAHYFEAVLRNVEKDDGTHFLSLNYFEKRNSEESMRLLTALNLKPNEAMKEVGFDDPAAKMVKNYLGLDMGAEANKDIAPDTGLKTGKEAALESVRDFYEYLPDRVHDLMDAIKDRHEELSPADFEGHRKVRADFQAGVDDVLGIIREGPDRGANKNWMTLEKAGFTPDEISKMPLMDDVQNATRRHGQNLSAFSKELDNQFTENLKAHGKELLKNPDNLSKSEMGQAVFWKHGIQVEGTDNLMLNRFIDAVDNKDLPKLLSSIGHNSQNPASQEIFERLTGETLGKTQKARVETLEKWAGSEVVQSMKSEQAEKAAARAIEKPLKNLQNRYDDLKNLHIRTRNGQGQEVVLNGHEYLSSSAEMGFKDTFSRKKGAVLEYGLLNKEEGIYRTVKDTRLTQFIKAARDVDSDGQWLPALEKAGIALPSEVGINKGKEPEQKATSPDPETIKQPEPSPLPQEDKDPPKISRYTGILKSYDADKGTLVLQQGNYSYPYDAATKLDVKPGQRVQIDVLKDGENPRVIGARVRAPEQQREPERKKAGLEI
ncbi:hypothetical protein A6M27_01105 [Acidithiobacillus thiooxidans]|uniref:DNA primase n=1 Tax=Acidithiobacillus thiooxidans TaxID=930 RepID=A0A1C2J5Q4_ACITH|nr:zincin-like metallopeptidase domain-containing protein [Acidithiobacillus thiooxidans]OCX72460.1 hypothetical protein A6P07_09675 [Acidithiobacillus thiooxidans]OCX77249.1 hypothetical protein A6O24_07130 [Acidithiobacillus thiooxidans]OCX83566.1 hypothetical protein A6O26_06645 [Acidithiobacillus thiooxidans]OCX89582.1 hypothetical protein A6M27_01105 [Acidithiobacillus thiooxidans]OFC45522.1 hypothetical protein BAE47_10315 [Acidithiobacillus thiooxidans]